MATELVWKALGICSKIYDPILYPHIITPDYATRQFSVETNYRKRKLFHMSTFILTMSLLMEIHFLLQSIYEPNFKHTYLIPFYVELTAVTGLHIIVTFVNHTMGHQLWGGLNEGIKFEEELRRKGRVTLEPFPQSSHFMLVRQEFRKVIWDKPGADKVGALSNIVAVLLIAVGLAWSPFGVYLNFDPGYFFFEYHLDPMSSQTWTTKIICFSIRLFLTYWSVLEATRSWALTLILHSAFVDVITRILRSIRRLQISECTTVACLKLSYIVQIGRSEFRCLTGVLLCSSFGITVVGNWLCLLGWEFIPIEVNISICLISLAVYISTKTYLPVLIKFNIDSELLINGLTLRYIRRHCFVVNNTLRCAGMSLRLWRKICRAQKPIIMYWCTSKFQKDTQVLFYSRIIDYTISFMLGYKASK